MNRLALSFLLATLAFACGLPARANAAEGAMKIQQANDSVTVTSGGKTLLRYQAAASPLKPYVKELFTPAGVQVLRDSPHDHKHHHALMFAVGVDGKDFWAEGRGAGTQKPLKTSVNATQTNGSGRAGFVQELAWIPPDGKALLSERRTIEVSPIQGPQPATLVTWNTRLTPGEGVQEVKLDGSHYQGLGMRFVVSMDQGGRFFNAAGEPGQIVRGSERLVRAKWSAYTAKADGKTVTAAIFDHPKNPRHPNPMFTMGPPFAYLSATLNLWKEPMTLKAGEALDLRYGVALWDGEVPAEQVESLYRTWAEAGKGGEAEAKD